MRAIAVSFKQDGKTVRGRVLQFITQFNGVKAVVEHKGRIKVMHPDVLKVLKVR